MADCFRCRWGRRGSVTQILARRASEGNGRNFPRWRVGLVSEKNFGKMSAWGLFMTTVQMYTEQTSGGAAHAVARRERSFTIGSLNTSLTR